MHRLALDTNAYRAFDDGNQAVKQFLQAASHIGLPIVTLGEIYFGIFDGSRQERNMNELSSLLANKRVEVLHINEVTARLFGEISTELKRLGKPIQQNDIWIAALCKQHAYTLVSSDRGFRHITALESLTF